MKIAFDTNERSLGPIGRWAGAAIRVLTMVGFMMMVAFPSSSAEPSAAVGGADVQSLKSLVSTIEDPAARKKLLGQLKALIGAAGKKEAPKEGLGARLIADLAHQIKEAGDGFISAAAVVSKAPQFASWLKAEIGSETRRAYWAGVFINIFLVLVGGFITSAIVRRLLTGPRATVEARVGDTLWYRVPMLSLRTLLDVGPILAFAAAAYSVLTLRRAGIDEKIIILTFINAYVVIGIVMAVARMLFVPAVSGLRVLPLGDEAANYLFIWIRRFVYVSVGGYFIIEAGLVLGLPGGAYGILTKLLGLVVATMVVVFIVQNRVPVGIWVRGVGGAGTGLQNLRNRLGDIWHVFAVIYVVAVFHVWLFSVEGGFEFIFRATLLTIGIFGVAHILAAGVRRGLQRIFSISSEVKARFPMLEKRANRYIPILHLILRVVIYGFAVLAVIEAWGIDSFGWLGSSAGQRILGSAFSIAAVLIIALILWEAVRNAIEHYLGQIDSHGNVIERSARARTLLPLLRNAVFVVLAVIVTLIVLSEMGVNIGPLLAGAGVIGLALGFGSQKLVQDVITGAFILFEDSISVGDVVSVSGQSGVVEALTIRSLRLRDASGNVHTVPFSAVDTVTNMTKIFSYYVFEIGVAYRESVDDVMDELRRLGSEMEADEEYGPCILEPLDILGVDALADSAVIIKARFKTVPIKQWYVGREFNRRIKNRFDELGIELPFPHTTIYFGEDKEGSAPPVYVNAVEGSAAKPIKDSARPKKKAASDTVRGSQTESVGVIEGGQVESDEG